MPLTSCTNAFKSMSVTSCNKVNENSRWAVFGSLSGPQNIYLTRVVATDIEHTAHVHLVKKAQSVFQESKVQLTQDNRG